MAERVRGAMFNILGDIGGWKVFDAYAGSGALAFEAASRGATEITATEIDYSAFKVLKQNVLVLDLGGSVNVHRANCQSWLRQQPQNFDLILLDPPYDKLNLQAVENFAQHLNVGGIMVLSHTGRTEVPRVHGVVVVETRSYGDAVLTFYRLGAQD